jgi:DNA-binding NarL/FixJ family response regulator
MLRKSILIVDDSPIIVDRLQNMLGGWENAGPIGQAGDYDSALNQLSERRPDIILLDINLPGKSGIALLQYIKTTYPSIIVIMISNQAGEYYRRICRQLGADHFIDKSTDFEEILPLVSSLLA